MQFSNQALETLRRQKKMGQLSRAKSLDNIRSQQLTPSQLKLLLALPKQPTLSVLQTHALKQELLIQKHLFDPFKYFGSPHFLSYQDAYLFHQPRLQAMFSNDPVITERKNYRKAASKINGKVEQSSPGGRGKASGISNQGRRTVGRSPKSYVKENKENFQRLNINNMQKVRVKLKIGKR